MTERWLLIDLGNTRLKWIWALDGQLDVDSAGRGGFGEFAEDCENPEKPEPDRMRLSSVAGLEATRQLIDFCEARWRGSVERLTSRADQGGVCNGYRAPDTLGVDRWLAAVGAFQTYGGPVVVWDVGTASTLDAVDEKGKHLGGWILPGPETMLAALRGRTQLLRPKSLASAADQTGRSTDECIANGVLGSQLGAMEKFLGQRASGSGPAPQLLVTGGDAKWLLPNIQREHVHDPWLVFRGMLVE